MCKFNKVIFHRSEMSEKRKEAESEEEIKKQPKIEEEKKGEDDDPTIDLKHVAALMCVAGEMRWRVIELLDETIRIHQIIYELLKKMLEANQDILGEYGPVDKVLNFTIQNYLKTGSMQGARRCFIEYIKLPYYMFLPTMNKSGTFKTEVEGPELPIVVISLTLEQLRQENKEMDERNKIRREEILSSKNVPKKQAKKKRK